MSSVDVSGEPAEQGTRLGPHRNSDEKGSLSSLGHYYRIPGWVPWQCCLSGSGNMIDSQGDTVTVNDMGSETRLLSRR